MAGYSDNREQNMEMKYLRKVLGEVDRDIAIPESIRGEVLRRKLDDVKPATYWPDMLRNLLRQKPRMATWQAVMSYAVAFAVILSVSYLLGTSDGLFQPQEPQLSPITGGNTEGIAPAMEAAVEIDLGTAPEILNESEQKPQDGADIQTRILPEDSSVPAEAEEEEELGTGGGGKTMHLLTSDGYTYNWRVNDTADPDKANYPVSIDIVSSESEIAAQIDISDMLFIEAGYLEADRLTIIGMGEGGVLTRVYQIADKENPVEGAAVELPGAYAGSLLEEGAVHGATRYTGVGEIEIPGVQESILDSDTQTACVLFILQPATGDVSIHSFAGATQVRLKEGGAEITYIVRNDSGEESQQTLWVSMSGMEIGPEE